ncbi:MAG: hypothetical protein ACYDAO_10260 [Thermoplasmataceae archaeon]
MENSGQQVIPSCTLTYLGHGRALRPSGSNCLAMYITAYELSFSNGQPNEIAYFIECQYTAGNNCCEIAGGMGVSGAAHQEWSGHTELKWAAYCSQGPSSTNHPYNWPLNCHSISKEAIPNNYVGFGGTSTSTQTTTCGIDASGSYGGLNFGGSTSYGNSVQFTSYEFCQKPMEMYSGEIKWQYSDNQGLMGQDPTAATTYLATEIQAQSSWSHIYEKTYAQFVQDCCTGSPTSLCVGGGFNFQTSIKTY